MRLTLTFILLAAVIVISMTVKVSAVFAGQHTAHPERPVRMLAAPANRPDADKMKQIAEKTQLLRDAVAALKSRKIPDDVLIEVEIYLKAAENIVRFEEWLNPASGDWTIAALEQGLERAALAGDGKAVWRDAAGTWVNRAYRSSIDGSIQPYAVLLPGDFDKTPGKTWRLDIVLHGRDGALTEAKFLATHKSNASKDLDRIQLEVYGRGNNAYRWAGETDVFEAQQAFMQSAPGAVDPQRVVLRGFSMGGAGTWHIGLHHPSNFCVIGPGAGFTTTHGYVPNLPAKLPEPQEQCLSIYDAVAYAQNVFNVPVVAYSGELDAQKKAADNIENELKKFIEPHQFTHLIGPGLKHEMPRPWQEKAETQYRKYADQGRDVPGRVRFVTYTPRYGKCDWVRIDALKRTFERAVIDATFSNGTFVVTTDNIRRFELREHPDAATVKSLTIDGVPVKCLSSADSCAFEWREDKWIAVDPATLKPAGVVPDKHAGLQGPIDDAFLSAFKVVRPSADGYAAATDRYASASLDEFAALWDRYFRGALPTAGEDIELDKLTGTNLVLFGDPRSNPVLRRIADKLPITWTPTTLVVNGKSYDASTHVPVFIYPNPLDPTSYIVVNTGHTFKEADLKGTNALLYPRLGDWAVIKPTPTPEAPAAYEVVASGLFDEHWQFPAE